MRPHRWQPTRLPHPWDSPGNNTGVGCHFLLQYMKVKSESEVVKLYPTPSDPMDCSLPGSSVHRIFQARVLRNKQSIWHNHIHAKKKKIVKVTCTWAGASRDKRKKSDSRCMLMRKQQNFLMHRIWGRRKRLQGFETSASVFWWKFSLLSQVPRIC